MKRFFIVAIAVIGVVIAFAPFAGGYAAISYYDEEGANRWLEEREAPIKVTIEEIERGVFGGVRKIGIVDNGKTQLFVEQSYKFGWFFTDRFPYIAIVKTSDLAPFSDDNASNTNETRGAAKTTISGNAYMLPLVGVNLDYTMNAPDELDADFAFAPPRIKASHNFISRSYDFAFLFPSISYHSSKDGSTLSVEDAVLSANGYLPQSILSDFTIKFEIKSAAIAEQNKELARLFDYFSELSVEGDDKQRNINAKIGAKQFKLTLSDGKIEVFNDPSASLTFGALDSALIKSFENRLKKLKLDEDLPKAYIANMSDNLFDKGAILSVKGEFHRLGKPFMARGSFKTNETIKKPDLTKIIVDVELEFDLEAITDLPNPKALADFDDLKQKGVLIERDNGLLYARFRYENSTFTINGKQPKEYGEDFARQFGF